MPALDSARLRKWADELDAEERAEKEAAYQERVDRLEAQLANGGLTDEQRATLAKAKEVLDALEAEPEEGDESGAAAGGKEGKAKSKAEGQPSPPKKKTRPGRKSGAAYDWYVDDEGNVVKSDTATVYTGSDEPDEVEIEEKAAE